MTDPNWLVLVIIPLALLIIQVALSVMVGLLLWQAKDFRKWIRETFAAHDGRIEKLKDDLSAVKEQMPKEYVLRDDFDAKINLIREDIVGVMTSVDRKLDAIGRAMTAGDRGA